MPSDLTFEMSSDVALVGSAQRKRNPRRNDLFGSPWMGKPPSSRKFGIAFIAIKGGDGSEAGVSGFGAAVAMVKT